MAIKKGMADRLSKIREKLANTDMASGGGAGFWTPKEGKHVIRILPEIGDMEFFFQEVGRHNFPGKDNKHTYCPKFTSGGELDCPVCELVDDFYKAGDKGSKEMAKSLRTRRMYWMNIIVRGKTDKNGNKLEEDTGPFIYTPGVMVFGDISATINDPDYGDVTDVESGFDITIERTGTGQMDTDYDVRARRNPSPLSDDPDQAQKWLDAAKDLSMVELTDDPEEDKEIIGDHKVWVSTYDRIVKEFGLDDFSVEEVDEDEDEDEDEEPVRKSSKTTVKTTSTSKKPVEVEEDDDEDEVEEEPVRKSTAKVEVNRRLARRRSR